MLTADRPLGAAADDLSTHAGPDGGLPVLAADGRRLAGMLRPVDLLGTPDPSASRDDSDFPSDMLCVIEIPPTPSGWVAPAGFTVLESPVDGPRMLVGPRSALEGLVASLPEDQREP